MRPVAVQAFAARGTWGHVGRLQTRPIQCLRCICRHAQAGFDPTKAAGLGASH